MRIDGIPMARLRLPPDPPLREAARHILTRPEIVYGEGAADAIPGLVRSLGHDSAFVVSDPGLVAAGVTPRVVAALRRDGLRVELYDSVGRNPSLGVVLTGSMALRVFGPSVVVAVGGGSPIDAAKAIALHAANDLPASELDHTAVHLQASSPLIAVPTTTGTGAETNGFGVIDDPVAQRKRYLGHPSAAPRYAVLDPALTTSAPRHITAACGVNILAHAVESMQARAGNADSAALAVEAVSAVFTHLPRAVADGGDLEARASLLLAAHRAGLAFATTGLGTAHALGHALSARYDIAHGVALAAVLVLVTEENRDEREPETARLAAAAGAADLPSAIAELLDRIGLRASLADLLVPRADLPVLAADARADAVIANAPRTSGEADLLALLEAAY